MFSLIPAVRAMYDGLLLNPHSCQSTFIDETESTQRGLYNAQCSFYFVLPVLSYFNKALLGED